MRLWVPSQKGFVTDAPHRHSAIDLPEPFAETSGCPASSTICTWATSSPRILYGPFALTTMVIGMEGGERRENAYDCGGGVTVPAPLAACAAYRLTRASIALRP